MFSYFFTAACAIHVYSALSTEHFKVDGVFGYFDALSPLKPWRHLQVKPLS